MSGLRLVSATAGTSWLHRMSPVPKLAWMTAGVVISLVTYDPVPLLVITALAVLAAASAGIAGTLVRTLLAFGPLAASILVIQALAPTSCSPACTAVATVGPLTFYEEGIVHGLSLVARLLAMEVVAFTVLLTTHPSDLFSGLEQLRVPRSISFAASMTLQLVPILEREFALVLAAQRARGLRASGPSALGRAIVPVVVGAVERVQQLSISLEARGFGGTLPRTSYREVVASARPTGSSRWQGSSSGSWGRRRGSPGGVPLPPPRSRSRPGWPSPWSRLRERCSSPSWRARSCSSCARERVSAVRSARRPAAILAANAGGARRVRCARPFHRAGDVLHLDRAVVDVEVVGQAGVHGVQDGVGVGPVHGGDVRREDRQPRRDLPGVEIVHGGHSGHGHDPGTDRLERETRRHRLHQDVHRVAQEQQRTRNHEAHHRERRQGIGQWPAGEDDQEPGDDRRDRADGIPEDVQEGPSAANPACSLRRTSAAVPDPTRPMIAATIIGPGSGVSGARRRVTAS